MSLLIEQLRSGCVMRPNRWSGDTHSDDGGYVDVDATDKIMNAAAAHIIELERHCNYPGTLPEEQRTSQRELTREP